MSVAQARGLVILLAIPVILSAGPRGCSPVDPAGSLQHPRVRAIVRVNPVQIGLMLPQDRVLFPNQFVVVTFTTIAGRYRHDPLDRGLVFERSGLRLVAHVALPATFSARSQTSTSLDLWLVRPLKRGAYVIIATVEGLLRGVAVHAESVARTVVIR